MADIFLSYVRSDAKRAKQVADALSARGWSVWWDVSLTPGVRFRDKIAEELHAARCVVVLWSKASIASDFVVDEAEDGKRRRVLVQALIEDVRPPHGFGQIQAATLTEWNGSNSDEFGWLCAGISRYAPLVSAPALAPNAQALEQTPPITELGVPLSNVGTESLLTQDVTPLSEPVIPKSVLPAPDVPTSVGPATVPPSSPVPAPVRTGVSPSVAESVAAASVSPSTSHWKREPPTSVPPSPTTWKSAPATLPHLPARRKVLGRELEDWRRYSIAAGLLLQVAWGGLTVVGVVGAMVSPPYDLPQSFVVGGVCLVVQVLSGLVLYFTLGKWNTSGPFRTAEERRLNMIGRPHVITGSLTVSSLTCLIALADAIYPELVSLKRLPLFVVLIMVGIALVWNGVRMAKAEIRTMRR
jgi:hypothetical protein